MRRKSKRTAHATLLGCLLVAGCASYRPAPLGLAPASLDAPPASVLSADASAIRRPFLAGTTIDLSRPLDLNAVATIAVLANPDLKALRLRAGVADAQAFSARLLPDPTFSVTAEPLLSGTDPVANLAAGLGVSLNALRTRGVARRQAAAQARQVRLDLAWSEWQTAGQARIQAVRVVRLEHYAALAEASSRVASTMLARVLRAIGRGDLLPTEAQASRTAAFDAAARLRLATRDLAAARLELRRLMGLPPDYAFSLAALPVPTAPPSAERLFAIASTGRTDLEALRAGYAAQEAGVRRAVLEQFPSLDLSIAGTRDTGRNVTLGPTVGLTLPLWNRNRGAIAVESATRAALRSEYDARLFATRAGIAAAASGLEVARGQRASILAGLPAARRFAEATRRAAARGDLPLASAETVEQAVRDQQLLVAQNDQDIAEQTIALELLTGAPQESWTR
jgi:cobalt-zinc-cadmium efflux system outer membrane protein